MNSTTLSGGVIMLPRFRQHQNDRANQLQGEDEYSQAILYGLLGAVLAPEGERFRTGVAFAAASIALPHLGEVVAAYQGEMAAKFEQQRRHIGLMILPPLASPLHLGF
jgi:hypothetical protein